MRFNVDLPLERGYIRLYLFKSVLHYVRLEYLVVSIVDLAWKFLKKKRGYIDISPGGNFC